VFGDTLTTNDIPSGVTLGYIFSTDQSSIHLTVLHSYDWTFKEEWQATWYDPKWDAIIQREKIQQNSTFNKIIGLDQNMNPDLPHSLEVGMHTITPPMWLLYSINVTYLRSRYLHLTVKRCRTSIHLIVI